MICHVRAEKPSCMAWRAASSKGQKGIFPSRAKYGAISRTIDVSMITYVRNSYVRRTLLPVCRNTHIKARIARIMTHPARYSGLNQQRLASPYDATLRSFSFSNIESLLLSDFNSKERSTVAKRRDRHKGTHTKLLSTGGYRRAKRLQTGVCWPTTSVGNMATDATSLVKCKTKAYFITNSTAIIHLYLNRFKITINNYEIVTSRYNVL